MNKIPRKALRELQNEINNTIYDFSDCSICGLCCKDVKLTLHTPDINKISRKLGMNKESFIDQYTHYHEEWNEIQMDMPCPFLKNNRCEIYQFRPEKCRNFPVFVTDEFVRTFNIEECAKATHFYQLFEEFIKKEYPEHYQKLINDYTLFSATLKNA